MSKDLTVGIPSKSVVPIGHPGFCFDDIANMSVTIVKLREGQTLKLGAIAVKACMLQLGRLKEQTFKDFMHYQIV